MSDLAKLGIVVDANGAIRELDKFDNQIGKTDRKAAAFGNTVKRVAGILGLGLIGRKILQETVSAQDAQARLAAALRATGESAGQSLAGLNAHASALQRITTFGDEDIAAAQARLLSYTGIVGKDFPRATQAVLDYAAAFGGDLVMAAEAVGKALNFPSVGMEALRKQGFILTEEQKKLIKGFEETGQLAKAQAIIFGELEGVTAGTAVAMRDTMGGALSGLKNAWGDLFEVTRGGSQGSVDAINAITESLEKSGLSMNSFITNTVVGWNNITAAVQKAKNWMTVDLSGGLRQAIAVVKELNAEIEKERLAANARATSPGKVGPAAGAGVGGAGNISTEATNDAIKQAKDVRAANEDMVRVAMQGFDLAVLEGAAQEKLAAEYDAVNKSIQARRELTGQLLEETLEAIEAEKVWKKNTIDRVEEIKKTKEAADAQKKYVDEMGKIWADGINKIVTDGFKSFQDFFENGLSMFSALMARMKAEGKTDSTGYRALGIGSAAIAGASAGYGIGQATGSKTMGALGGAASGAMAGAAFGHVGIAVGAVAGFVGGIIGAGKAAREAARQMKELQAALKLSFDDLRARVAGDTLAQELARNAAELQKFLLQINQALPGTANEKERNKQRAEAAALFGQLADQIRQAAEQAKRYAQEDLGVRLLAAQGHDKEAAALRVQLDQQREMQAARDANMSAEYLLQLQEVQRLEAIKKAQDEVSKSALNMVQGYKLQSTIFGAMGARSPVPRLSPQAPTLVPSMSGGQSTQGGSDLTVNLVLDGRVVGKTTLKILQNMAQARFGDSTMWSQVQ